MKRKLSIAVAAVAVAAGVLLPADLAGAEDASGRVCTDLQNAIDYHEWRSGTKDPDGRLTPDAQDSLSYLQQLRRWYDQYNCDVALGKSRSGTGWNLSPVLD